MKKNYIYNTLYQVISLIIPIITMPYLARTLGADSVGVFSYTLSIATFFSIVAVLGTTTYGQRSVARVRDDRKKLSEIFFSIVTLRSITSLLAIIIYVGLVFFMPNYKLALILMSLYILNVIFDITWFYQGIECFKTIVIRNIVVKILNLLSVFVFVHNEKDLSIYILIYCGYTIIGNFVTWLGIKKYVDYVKNIRPFENISEILQLFIPAVAMQVYTVLDKAMLGTIVGSMYESGCYEQAEKICRISTTIVAAVAIVIAPRIANLYGRYEKKEIDKREINSLAYMGIRVACMMAFPIMFGLISVIPVFVPVFLGEGYGKVYFLLPIFSLLILVVGLANVVGVAYLISIKKQKIYTIAVTISAVTNFVLNFFLIPQMASIGAAIASVVAESLGLAIQIIYCIKNENFSPIYLIKIIWRYFISALLMFGILVVLIKGVSNDIIGLSILICAGVIVYGILLMLFKDELFIKVVKDIMAKIKVNRKDKE